MTSQEMLAGRKPCEVHGDERMLFAHTLRAEIRARYWRDGDDIILAEQEDVLAKAKLASDARDYNEAIRLRCTLSQTGSDIAEMSGWVAGDFLVAVPVIQYSRAFSECLHVGKNRVTSYVFGPFCPGQSNPQYIFLKHLLYLIIRGIINT